MFESVTYSDYFCNMFVKMYVMFETVAELLFSKFADFNFTLVPGAGIEPARHLNRQGILSPSCLPISPPGRVL